MAVKINSLEFENVKRIKAVSLTPTTDGLTVIGGKNAQGKTSVLDAIAWAVGGDKYKPSEPKRQGSYADPRLRVVLSNGIVVERSGKNSALKVIDPNGNKGGQQLLNSFIESFALDIPKFMQQSDREKADTLLRIIGVGDKLHELEHREMMTYNERTAIGRIAEQKDKFAKEMPVYTNVHIEPVSVSELIRQQQDILARNGERNCIKILFKPPGGACEALSGECCKGQQKHRIGGENMEITLCMIGLMIAALTLWYQFLKMLADNAEYKRQQQAEKNTLIIVEKKGKGWDLIENKTDN